MKKIVRESLFVLIIFINRKMVYIFVSVKMKHVKKKYMYKNDEIKQCFNNLYDCINNGYKKFNNECYNS